MIYEHNNVPEPTCEGWWWKQSDQNPTPILIDVLSVEGRFVYDVFDHGLKYCREEGVTWTGPIDPPEDKPVKKTELHEADAEYHSSANDIEIDGYLDIHARNEDELAQLTVGDKPATSEDRPGQKSSCTCTKRKGERHADDCEWWVEHKPATSEDEGEKWGHLLWKIDRQVWSAPDPWQDCRNKKEWIEVALRFRDECVAPHERLAEISRRVCNLITGHDGLADEVCDLSSPPPLFPKPPRALPDQGEAVEDKQVDVCAEILAAQDEADKDKPRPSDKEVGRVALAGLHMQTGNVLLNLPDDQLAEWGSTIRAKLARRGGLEPKSP